MTETPETDSVINVQEALIYTAGDPEMLASMAELFLVEGPKQLQQIDTQVKAGNLEGIRKGAHSLKGSITIFAAREAVAAALELERVANEENAALIPDAWNALTIEVGRLLDDAQRLRKRLAE
ncbi:MAG: Hpt domain-containing protein [Pirellulaceae bacterium]|nr:Hpt domain-containing protein [Pirellulaceae bacterium]